jgi:hypothetical protein
LQKEHSIASICDQFETLEKQEEALKSKNGLSLERKKLFVAMKTWVCVSFSLLSLQSRWILNACILPGACNRLQLEM